MAIVIDTFESLLYKGNAFSLKKRSIAPCPPGYS
jgi:hypothetical protein